MTVDIFLFYHYYQSSESEHSSEVILARGVGVSCGWTACELSLKFILLHSPMPNLPEKRSKMPLATSLTLLLPSATETLSVSNSEFQAGPGTAAMSEVPRVLPSPSLLPIRSTVYSPWGFKSRLTGVQVSIKWHHQSSFRWPTDSVTMTVSSVAPANFSS